MKRVLLTNAYISGYSGSELDTVEIAHYFLNNGYLVDIFTLKVGKTLVEEISSDIRILTMDNINDLHSEYEILWAHHYPLLDYLLFTSSVKFKYIHYVCLSSLEALEQIPIYYKKMNMVSVMSYNTREKLIKENPIYEKDRINIFPNYALKEYFTSSVKNYKRLKKVAIVSNHVPIEVLDMKSLLEKDKVVVDIYGINYLYVKVDKDVLKKYDLVISIGKTCFYSVALGIPTYVYDRFGGLGYVNLKNIDFIFKGNFVCSTSAVKKSGYELYQDIIHGYSFSKLELQKLKQFGMDNFCFEINMDLLLKKLLKTKLFSNSIMCDSYLFLKKTSSLYVERISDYEKILKRLEYELVDKKQKCQLFFAKDNNFSEDNSFKKISNFFDGRYEVEFLISEDVKKIRFDFCEEEAVMFFDFQLNGNEVVFDCHDLVMIEDCLVSISNDPYVVIHQEFKKNELIRFTYRLKKYSMKDVCRLLDEKNQLYQKLKLIVNGRFYKFYSKAKKLLFCNKNKK